MSGGERVWVSRKSIHLILSTFTLLISFEYLLHTLIETKSSGLSSSAQEVEVNDETKYESINIHVLLNAVGCIKIRGAEPRECVRIQMAGLIWGEPLLLR